MPNFSRRLSSALERLSGDDLNLGRRQVPPRVARAVDHGVAVEHGRAAVQVARVRGLGQVAHEAMQDTGHLAVEEAFWLQRTPAHAAGRFTLIADNAAINMANIVDETGRE